MGDTWASAILRSFGCFIFVGWVPILIILSSLFDSKVVIGIMVILVWFAVWAGEKAQDIENAHPMKRQGNV